MARAFGPTGGRIKIKIRIKITNRIKIKIKIKITIGMKRGTSGHGWRRR